VLKQLKSIHNCSFGTIFLLQACIPPRLYKSLICIALVAILYASSLSPDPSLTPRQLITLEIRPGLTVQVPTDDHEMVQELESVLRFALEQGAVVSNKKKADIIVRTETFKISANTTPYVDKLIVEYVREEVGILAAGRNPLATKERLIQKSGSSKDRALEQESADATVRPGKDKMPAKADIYVDKLIVEYVREVKRDIPPKEEGGILGTGKRFLANVFRLLQKGESSEDKSQEYALATTTKKPGKDKMPAKAASYVDELIDKDVKEEEFDIPSEEEAGILGVGRSFLSTEYLLFQKSGSAIDRTIEHGVAVLWNRETVNYGQLSFDYVGQYIAEGLVPIGADRVGEKITLRQDEFVISDNWQMDSALGDFRARTNRLISSSFRFNLPSSLLRGIETRFYSDNTEIRLTGGRRGFLQGTAVSTFERLDDTLWGLAATRTFAGLWTVGLQSWSLKNSPSIINHESFAGLIQYWNEDRQQKYQLHTLADSTGNWGLWMDGESRIRRWQHKFGIFRFEPELLWTDVQIVNDLQGFYWRADTRSYLRTWSLGLDLNSTNVRSDPDLSGIITVRGFISNSRRLNFKTTIGGNVNFGLQRSGPGISTEPSESYEITGFVNREFDFGFSRLQVDFGETLSDVSPQRGYSVMWDHDWNLPRRHNLNNTLSWEYQDDDGDVSKTTTAGLSYRGSIMTDLELNSNLVFVRSEGDTLGRSRDINFNLGLFWRPLRDWQVGLTANWAHNVLHPPTGLKLSDTERRFLLTVRRAHTAGRSPILLGRERGRGGNGRVTGRVFFDENHDGKWSPNEAGIASLPIYLNDRFVRQTDRDGLFEFWPVPTGEHDIIIGLEDVPLPWTLDDESPRKIEVFNRDDTIIDFPLVRLNR